MIGCTVDEALDARRSSFLDETMLTDQRSIRARPRHRHRPAAARDRRLPQAASAGGAFRGGAGQPGRRRRDGRRAEGRRVPAPLAALPPAVHRRPEAPRRHRRGDSGLRLAQEDRRHLQGALSVPRREDAVVPRQPRQGVLPLLRLRRRRRRLQVPRAARQGRVRRRGEAAGAALRDDRCPELEQSDEQRAERGRARRRCSRSTSRRRPGSASSWRRRRARGSGQLIESRGVSAATSEALGLGFAPPGRDPPEAGARSTRAIRRRCSCAPACWCSATTEP